MSGLRHLTLIETLTRGGGAEQALLSLLPELKKRGFQPEVATLWPPDDLAGDLEAQGIPVHRLNIDYRHRWNLPYTVAKTTRLIQKVKPDILHAHLFFAVIYGGLSPRFHRNMVRVMSIHSMDYERFPAVSAYTRARKRLHGYVLQNAYNACVAVSEAAKVHYFEHFSLDNMAVIPNPIPVDRILARPKLERTQVIKQHGLPDGVPILVMSGRLIPPKGHDVLFQALTILRHRNVRLHCALAGHGPLEASLKKKVRELNLENLVSFLGFVPHGDLMDLIRICDIVTMPSTLEGFGIAAAEALAMETPVIASDIGALAEFVQHERAGLLFPCGDADALADSIMRLVSTPDLGKALGLEGRRIVEARFTPADVAEAWSAKYQSVRRQQEN
jgi:glycosyltransferase involved in cell wall biosynthesis